MPELTKTDSYRIITFNELPVREQRRVDDLIKVSFYNGTEKLVTEQEWRNHSCSVLIPKNLGGRKHVATNWKQYQKVLNSRME
jgi:hypothetical protein